MWQPSIRIECRQRLTGGAPSDIVLFPETAQIARGLIGYEHTIAATFGFESLRLEVVTDLDSAIGWLDNLLMGFVVTSPDAVVIWEGYLHTVDLAVGQEQVSVSIDHMANRVKARYTTYLGTPGVSSTVSNTTSQATYGVKDLVLALGTTDSTAATAAAARKLADIAYPRGIGGSAVATGPGVGDVRMTLTCMGWRETLNFVVTSSTTTTTADTGTQIGGLLATLASTNAFISTATTLIGTTGVSVSQFIPADTTYAARIEQLLSIGNSSNVRLCGGVYEDRVFRVDAWAGATPTILTYQRFAGEAFVRNMAMGVVPWWEVRPNTMYQRNDLLDVAPVATQADTAGRFAIERVTCRIDESGVSLALESADLTSADAMIARLS